MRDPTIYKWPNNIITIDDIEIEMERPASSGPKPLIGRPQVAVSPAGGWRLTYHGALAHRGNIQAFRAMLAQHRGRARPIYVGPYDYANDSVALAGGSRTALYTFVGGYTFLGGYYFEASITDCTLAADASMGATEIEVTNSVLAPLIAGQYFEINGRLHIVEQIIGNVWTIWPGLRADYASGTWLEISDPRMEAYLDLEETQAMRYQVGPWGEVSLPFIEAGW